VTVEGSAAWLPWAFATASTVIGVILGFALHEVGERFRRRAGRRSLARAIAAEIKAAVDHHERAVGAPRTLAGRRRIQTPWASSFTKSSTRSARHC
jgi:hypothetical protein